MTTLNLVPTILSELEAISAPPELDPMPLTTPEPDPEPLPEPPPGSEPDAEPIPTPEPDIPELDPVPAPS